MTVVQGKSTQCLSSRLRGIMASSRTITERHLKRGEACPELKPDKWRIYSMKYCPYAQRTRMVLIYKDIPHETVNVNLKEKPRWLFEKNPIGVVPVIERNESVVYESTICDDYLDEVYPNKPLYPSDPYQKARHRLLMDAFGKVTSTFHKLLRKSDPEKLNEIKKSLGVYEAALCGKFFGGDNVGMLDLHIWPWIERSEVPEMRGLNLLEDFPKLSAWKARMKEQVFVKETYVKPESHLTFFTGLMQRKPEYDFELEAKL